MIDKNSYVPLSRQLSDLICRNILSGDLLLGDQLPSQMQLTQQYGISRITVSQALRDLCKQGILKSYKGKGTFVQKIPRQDAIQHTVRGLTRDQSFSGLPIETKVLSINDACQKQEVLQKLGLPLEGFCIEICRLRIINHIKAAIETSYLTPLLFPNVSWAEIIKDDVSLYTFLRQKFSISIFKAEEDIAAVLPNKELQNLLQLSENTPLLSINRLTFSKNKTAPFEFCHYYMLSEFFGKSVYVSL